MNILFICSARVWGGNEKWSSMAIAGLKEHNNVIFLGKNPDLHQQFNPEGISYTAPFRWNFDIKSKTIIQDIALKHNIDLIISTKKKEYFLAGLVSRKYNIKHIIRLGIVRKMKLPYWSKMVYQKLNDGIIVNAQSIKNGLLQYPYFNAHPIKVIYNGIPNNASTNSKNYDSDKFCIVSTGMLTNRKGFHILIEAISLLSEKDKSKVRLHIIGKGREEDNLKKMVAEMAVTDSVIFEGFSKNPTEYLHNADLFALISGNEGISNAIIEAMYASVPVLTTTAGGTAEVITNKVNGFLTTRDSQEVANILQQLISQEKTDLQSIGEAGKKKASQMFNLETMNKSLQAFASEITKLQ